MTTKGIVHANHLCSVTGEAQIMQKQINQKTVRRDTDTKQLQCHLWGESWA